MKTITEKIAEEAARVYFEDDRLSVAECIEIAEQRYEDAEGELNG